LVQKKESRFIETSPLGTKLTHLGYFVLIKKKKEGKEGAELMMSPQKTGANLLPNFYVFH